MALSSLHVYFLPFNLGIQFECTNWRFISGSFGLCSTPAAVSLSDNKGPLVWWLVEGMGFWSHLAIAHQGELLCTNPIPLDANQEWCIEHLLFQQWHGLRLAEITRETVHEPPSWHRASDTEHTVAVFPLLACSLPLRWSFQALVHPWLLEALGAGKDLIVQCEGGKKRLS